MKLKYNKYTVKFTPAMNPFHFSIFKQSLKAGVPPEGKQASPDETVRKVINPNTHTHTHTEQDQSRQENRSERKLSGEQVTTAEAVSELFNSNKNRREVLHINVLCYR